ncbi:hypothetical protein DM02DRAFT_650214 [Periconia macrospinosa]|uniref:Extracellular membrane protein CFEM domain-containing protein n=1 Tax=Periconia macrospinosa TaxID=97972 RepID=A0A2V1E5U3_9PLEO|nr:hypothetical protein DM02DRAFT_650214 [Periconia macrospinosa]
MPSVSSLAVIATQLLALAAATSTFSRDSKYDWVADSVPSCFKECLESTEEGCHSQQCICSASQSDAFLTTAAECARDKCEKNGLEINVALLVPAQIYCSAVGNTIPSDAIKSAYECAMGGTVPTSTHKSPTSTAKQQSESEFKSTVTSTVTMTSVDDDGHTLRIIQPVAMGPSTLSSGKAVTSTLNGSSSSSTSSASSSSTAAAASPSQSAQVSSPAPTQTAPSGAPSSTQKADNGGGSPFVNMQASDATRWCFSGPIMALGFIAGVFGRA